MSFFRIFFFGLFISSIIVLTGCQSGNEEGAEMDGPEIPLSKQDVTPSTQFDNGPEIDSDFEFKGPGELGKEGAPPPQKDGVWQPLEGIDLPTIYFAYDQDSVGTSERSKLDKVAEYLLQNPSVGVIIEGHCDERGSIEYNRALGERRAIAIRNYLVSLGVPDARFQTVSFGEERPAVDGNSPEAWAKNRRAELVAAKMN